AVDQKMSQSPEGSSPDFHLERRFSGKRCFPLCLNPPKGPHLISTSSSRRLKKCSCSTCLNPPKGPHLISTQVGEEVEVGFCYKCLNPPKGPHLISTYGHSSGCICLSCVSIPRRVL